MRKKTKIDRVAALVAVTKASDSGDIVKAKRLDYAVKTSIVRDVRGNKVSSKYDIDKKSKKQFRQAMV